MVRLETGVVSADLFILGATEVCTCTKYFIAQAVTEGEARLRLVNLSKRFVRITRTPPTKFVPQASSARYFIPYISRRLEADSARLLSSVSCVSNSADVVYSHSQSD